MSAGKSGDDFWSRRKAAVREAEAREEAEERSAIAAQSKAELEEKSDEEILEELGLPNPQFMKEGDDFKAFLTPLVPERLRRRALRRLWLVNPALANLDGLIEYGEDYTDAATVVENLQTTYQVGKGMLEHINKMAEQASIDNSGPERLEDEEFGDLTESADLDENGEEVPTENAADAETGPEIGCKEKPQSNEGNKIATVQSDSFVNQKTLTGSHQVVQDVVIEEVYAELPTEPSTEPGLAVENAATVDTRSRMRFTFN